MKEDKINEAKKYKENNRILKENILLLKEKYIDENIQKKVICLAKDKILKSSIKQYNEYKKDVIKEIIKNEVDNESVKIKQRENELMFMKNRLKRLD